MASAAPKHQQTLSSHEAFANIMHSVDALRVRDVRKIFAIMRKRSTTITSDSFLTKYGFTVGEFSTAYVLNQNHYKRNKK